MHIIVKTYEHFNRSLPNWDTPKGKYIRSKKQYVEEMKKGGFVDYEQACRVAEQTNKNKVKYRGLTPKAEALIKAASLQNRKNFKLSDKMIDGMKEIGVNFYNDNVPKHYRDEGGFDG